MTTTRKLAAAAVVLFGLAGTSLAGGGLPWREDVIIRGDLFYQLGWRHWPATQPSSNIAPWFLWWPANANETLTQHDFQTSPYPGWQTPAGYPSVPRPAGQMTYGPPNQPIPFQPVGYPRPQQPSYWYGR